MSELGPRGEGAKLLVVDDEESITTPPETALESSRLSLRSRPGGGSVIRVEHVMGTAVSFATEHDPEDGAIDRSIAWLHWVDHTFSVHRPDSQIMQIRSGGVAESDLHPEVAAVLERCMALRIVSDGRFDHRPEGDLDPSGYVKGWAIDRAAAILSDAGLTRFYVDAGGDIAVRGRWSIGIRNPLDPTRTLIGLDLTDQAIATSGKYERGEHIWGDSTGSLASISVVGPDLGTADAISTALFSSQGGDTDWLDRFPGYEVIAVTNDLEVLTSAGLAAALLRVFSTTRER